jgi:hypothetical protein
LRQHWREGDPAHVANVGRDSIVAAHDNVADVSEISDEAGAVDYLLLAVMNDVAAAST